MSVSLNAITTSNTGAIEQSQVGRREIDVVDLAVLNIAHALVVADAQGQHRAHHGAAISDVSVEQQCWVGDLHLFVVRIDVIPYSCLQ